MVEQLKEWFDFDYKDMINKPNNQKEVFLRMIQVLEKRGDCREVFHNLAEVLFQDRME